MTNLILPRRKLIAPAMAAGLAAASPAMGHNGGPSMEPATETQVRAAIEQTQRMGLALPLGSLPSDPTLAMFMMAKMSGMLVGGSGEAGLRPQDVFAAIAYPGLDSDRYVTTGVDLSTTSGGPGGLFWVKSRTATLDHGLFDTARGINKYLSSNSTSSESSNAGSLQQFGSDGVQLGTASIVNTQSSDYIGLSFRCAEKFFGILTWTGNGGGSRSISHPLTIPPGMVIVKAINSTTDWPVFHKESTGDLYLNNNSGPSGSLSDITSVSSSVINVGSSCNVGGVNYVGYVFADDPSPGGVIRCGLALGGTTVNLGWRPQFLQSKIYNISDDWAMYDTARGWGAGSDRLLVSNRSNAETGNDIGEPTSSGFTISGAYSGYYLFYMAIREPV